MFVRRCALIAVLLLTACSKPGAPPAMPEAPEPAPGPAAPFPAKGPAWRKVMESGSANLFHTAPEGFILSDGGKLLHIRFADARVEELSKRTVSFTFGAETVEAQLAETPYGTMLVSPETPGPVALSPDGRRLAIARNGLWVADVQTGAVHRAGSQPEPQPPVMIKHQPWDWAAFPSWSEDGQWIYFSSTRLRPGEYSRWRVPAAGGAEELVSRVDMGPFYGARLPNGDTVLVSEGTIQIMPGGGGPGRVVASGVPSPYSQSPDGRWVVALDGDRSALVIYEASSGRRREIAMPAGSWPEMSLLWDGDQALMRTRPLSYNGNAYLSVLDLDAATLTHYAPPDPAGGNLWPLGLARGRVLARVLPWMDHHFSDPAASRSAPSGVWLLEPAAYQPPPAAAPAVLRSAMLHGAGPIWEQAAGTGPVRGGEISALPQSALALQFDRPVDEAWMRQEILVEGPGALLMQGGQLGMAIVQMTGARAGDLVHIRVPSLGFDLQVRLEERAAIALDVRTAGGEWEEASAQKHWPRGPLDLRIRFGRPVERRQAQNRLADILRPVEGARFEWADDNNLIIRLPNPPGALRLNLAGLADAKGFAFATEALPPVYTGPEPLLVAVDEGRDIPVAAAPPEVIGARIEGGALHVTYWDLLGETWPRTRERTLDLAALRWSEGSAPAPVPADRDLALAARHGDQVAGIVETGWLGKAGGYLYEGALAVRDGSGRETHRFPGLHSVRPFFFTPSGGPAWSADGKRLSVLTASEGSHALLIADLADGATRLIARGLAGGPLHWSPDGRHIAVGSQVVEAASGKVIAELPAHLHLRWSPDGARILYNRDEWGEVLVRDLAEGQDRSLGSGLPAGWDRQGRPLLIRWESSDHRYVYHGI